MKSLYLTGILALVATLNCPALGQTPPAEDMPPAAPAAEAPPVSKLPGAIPESSPPVSQPTPPMAEVPAPPPPVEPLQAVSAPPPPQAVYPPCTATLQDQCTNSPRSAGHSVKRKPRSRR
jgi:hypothetical protein